MEIKLADYRLAIDNLEKGLTQLESDGRDCAICGDGSHQAFECHHNPIVIARAYDRIIQTANTMHDHLHSIIGIGATTFEAFKAGGEDGRR